MHDLRFDIAALHAAYRDGADPADVMAEVFRRIDAADDPGIFIHLRERDAVLAEVGRLGPFDPETRPLWGLPFAIKDNIDLAGAPTTAGCPAFAYQPDRDAFVVATLRRAGAIPIGKTLLYVEPIYLKAETAAYPELRLVVVMHDDNLSYGNTFDEALEGLFKEGAPRIAEEKTPTEIGEASVPALIQRANDAFENYLKYLGQKQFEQASGSLEDLEQALKRLAGKSQSAVNSDQ